MIFWIAIILAITLWRVRTLKGEDGYTRECTSAVNGFFALFILLSHARMFMNSIGYSWFGEVGARYAMYFLVAIGQLCVVPFLFFSGYGMVERIKSDGLKYVRNIPKKRVLSFYIKSLPVAVAWTIYGAFISSTISPADMIGQLTFWKGIDFGPCWYNFCIMVMYMIACLAFLSTKRISAKGVSETLAWMLALGYVIALSLLRPDETWWYNTALAFPLGISFSLHKDVVLQFIEKRYWHSLFAAIIAIGALYSFSGNALLHNLYSLSFMILLIIVMYRLRFGNPILNWIGARVFAIYMYHLLFYRLISKAWCAYMPLTWGGVHVVLALSFACTGIVAWRFRVK